MQKLKLLIYFIMIISAINCSEKKSQLPEEIKIAVTLPPFADFVKNIVADRAEIIILVPPGTNAHSYEPTPGNIKNLLNSNIYFRVGKSFKLEEIIFSKVKIDTSITQTIDCSKGIEIINNDPHYWLSPKLVKSITETMLEVLVEKYPHHKNFFTNNTNRFLHKLDSIDANISTMLSNKKERSFLVYHPAWTYLAQHYNLQQFAVEQDGKSPKADELKEFIDLAVEKNANTIFFDPHFDNASVTTIANSLNIKIESLDPLPVNYLENLSQIGKKFEMSLK
ncbi:MAG: zinc ABC transporter substrate-binding protein [Ignavibacteriae bacterium]|nr:zinc ABC transporter substrate-binding protein [Ignavibacteriota bacterium]